KAFALFNRRRAEAGVGKVDYDFGLAYGCQLHAKYLAQHPDAEDPHTEEAGKAGFSEAGKKAAENSVVGFDTNLVANVDVQFGTFFHRIRMIEPSTFKTGMGLTTTSRGYCTLVDILSATSESETNPKWVIYPPDKTLSVFCLMYPEDPSPVPT